jgi:hypothetical protein
VVGSNIFLLINVNVEIEPLLVIVQNMHVNHQHQKKEKNIVTAIVQDGRHQKTAHAQEVKNDVLLQKVLEVKDTVVAQQEVAEEEEDLSEDVGIEDVGVEEDVGVDVSEEDVDV